MSGYALTFPPSTTSAKTIFVQLQRKGKTPRVFFCSTEYMGVRGEITGDNIYRCQSVCPVVLNDFDFLKKI
jgi:hypothetical protein